MSRAPGGCMRPNLAALGAGAHALHAPGGRDRRHAWRAARGGQGSGPGARRARAPSCATHDGGERFPRRACVLQRSARAATPILPTGGRVGSRHARCSGRGSDARSDPTLAAHDRPPGSDRVSRVGDQGSSGRGEAGAIATAEDATALRRRRARRLASFAADGRAAPRALRARRRRGGRPLLVRAAGVAAKCASGRSAGVCQRRVHLPRFVTGRAGSSAELGVAGGLQSAEVPWTG